MTTDDDVETLTITVAGDATLEALYTGTNDADYRSLLLLKQQLDLLDAAIANTYLTQAACNAKLADYYTQTEAGNTFAAKTALDTLSNTLTTTYTNTTGMNNAINTAINTALGNLDGLTVAAKIEAVKTALEESLSDLDTALGGRIDDLEDALNDLKTRVETLENGTAALVLDETKATLLRTEGFADNTTQATIATLNTYFQAGKRYYYALDNVSGTWLNMPLAGALTGTLTFARTGDILTVTLAVSRVDTTCQYREYKGMWLLTGSAFTWQQNAAGAAPNGWIPVVTGAVTVSLDGVLQKVEEGEIDISGMGANSVTTKTVTLAHSQLDTNYDVIIVGADDNPWVNCLVFAKTNTNFTVKLATTNAITSRTYTYVVYRAQTGGSYVITKDEYIFDEQERQVLHKTFLGKPVYRKCFDRTWAAFAHNITSLDVFTTGCEYSAYTNSSQWLKLPYYNFSDSTHFATAYPNGATVSVNKQNLTINRLLVVLEYTKTTD